MAIRTNTQVLEEGISKAFDNDNLAKKDKRSENKGRPPKDIRFTQKNIRMEESDWRAVGDWCADHGLSTSDGIRMAVKEWLNKIRKGEKND